MELKFSDSDGLYSSVEMRKLEEDLCLSAGKSPLDLMEAAGYQLAAYIDENFEYLKELSKKCLIISGPGNNGGDGFVAARYLRELGFGVDLVLIESSKYSPELQSQIESAKTNGNAFVVLGQESAAQTGRITLPDFTKILEEASLVLDCILGSGQQGEPRGLLKDCVQAIIDQKQNRDDLKIVSTDLPTGINSDSGAVYSPHITADVTLVIQNLKLGMVQCPALDTLGQIVLLDAGIESAESEHPPRYRLISSVALKSRSRVSHKGDYGHVLVVAGNRSMPGAGLLAAAGCLRSGAGLVTSLSFGQSYVNSYPELMYFNTSEKSLSAVGQNLITALGRFSVVIIGPGLGLSEDATGFVYQLLREINARNMPCVLDADALSALAQLSSMQVPLSLPSVVMTPHPGEAARLLNISVAEVQNNRYQAAEKLAALFNCCVVLKGASTICFSGDSGYVNSSGGAFMATAGSGDVLAGIIAALLAQGEKKTEAAAKAVFLHGLAAELAHAEHNGPIIASDIIAKIPFAFGKYAD